MPTWAWFLLALAVVSSGLAYLVATDRLSWRTALELGGLALGLLGWLLAGVRRPGPRTADPAPDPEPSHRLADQVGAAALEEREAAREEREALEADPAAPVAGRLSGAVGATRRRRP